MTEIFNVFGVFSGFLALSIAIYLQFMVIDRVPSKYVFSYALLGLSIVLISTNASVTRYLTVATVGYIIVILLQLWGLKVISSRISLQCTVIQPIKELHESG